MTVDESHSQFPHVYVVVRIDFPFNASHPGNTIAVVKVARSREAAEAEVSRLNQSTLTRTALMSVVSRGSSTSSIRGSRRGASTAVELRFAKLNPRSA